MKNYDKIKWVVTIFMVFALVLTTNLIDKKNFQSISDSIVTIYEDRLVVKNIIFELSSIIHKKEVAFLKKDAVFFNTQNSKLNKDIEEAIQRFRKTKLTDHEKTTLEKLKKNMSSLTNTEETLVKGGFSTDKNYESALAVIHDNLKVLASIQLEEGRKHFILSQKTIGVIELFTQIEIYFLIFLAVLVHIVILYKPKSSSS
ncbi:MAG: MCP four helix bundle domain-containing protein, partial [Bacteroidetes bacterium]|nr:MCP four helix bundle domain-containing protein [Bacteroidota bacterium]